MDEAREETYFAGILLQVVFLAVGSALLVFLITAATELLGITNTGYGFVISLAVAVSVTQVQDFVRRYFFVRNTPFTSFASDVLRYVSQLLFILVALHFSQSSTDIFWIFSFTSLVGSLVILRKAPTQGWSLQNFRNSLGEHWHISKWLLPSAILQWVSRNVFILISGVLIGTPAVGALKATQSLIGITHIFFQGMENIVPPRAAAIYQRSGTAAMDKYLKKIAIVSIVFVLIVSALLAVDPAFWFLLVFGEEFVEFSFLVYWFIPVYILLSLGLPLRSAFLAIETLTPVFRAYALTSVIVVPLAVIFIGRFGLTATMLSMLAFQIVLYSQLIYVLARKASNS